LEAQQPRVFYRVVKTNPPTRDDFIPNALLGKPPPRDRSPDAMHLWEDCISVQETLAQFRSLTSKFHFRLGEFVGAVRIEDDAPITVTATLSLGHFSLEGDAQEMLNRVVSVESAFLSA
jgi:hypothetical protein